VAGNSHNGTNNDFALVRYNADGTLDTSFSGDGMVTTAIGSGDDKGFSVAVQADGKILMSGESHNGSDYDVALVRYNADGTLDTSFSSDGLLTTAIGSGDERGRSVTLQSDGKILVAGNSHNGTNNDFALVRYNADGTLDTSFSGDGFLTTAIGSGDESVRSVTVQADGKILMAGESYNGSDRDFALVRYNSDGSLDKTFDSTFINTLDGTPSFTEDGPAVVLDADVQIFDAELSSLDNFDGATLTLVRNGGASTDDAFSATGTLGALTEGGNLVVGATTIGAVTTNSGGTLLLTFNANATNALVDSAMQQIAYANSSDTPPASAQLDWTFDDGNSGSQGTGGALQALGSTTVTITAVNDAPTASATATNPTSTEGDAAVDIFNTVNVSTIESGQTIEQIVLTVTNVTDGSNETINIDGSVVFLVNGDNDTTGSGYD
ncbi:MAG: hypothetical protein GY906_28730, partial [bacterium]|nr:hypothetical protein [bacterium]